jgi:hypothetical protein
MREIDDQVAEAIRLAYAKAEPAAARHIEAYPWEGLSAERKAKWLAMAHAAADVIGS